MARKEERHNLPAPGGRRPTTKKATRGRPSSRASLPGLGVDDIDIDIAINIDVFASC
jgi:hypothetical protein